MSSIDEIMNAFAPVLQESRGRAKNNQSTQLDLRITNLAKVLRQQQNSFGSGNIDNFEIVNTHLSHALTLSDLKTSQECSSEATALILTFLRLQQNLDKMNPVLPVMERIKAVSESVLKHVQLFHLQITGFVIPPEHSPVWYALATDDQFLNRQVRDLTEFHIATEVAAARILDIEKRKPDSLNSLNATPFKTPWLFGTLDLTLGKLRLLSGEELNKIARKLPPSAGKLISDNQIRNINFSLFTGEFLDEMIGGDNTDEEISRRLAILDSDQIEIFLKKSKGSHFAKFSDSFYQMLPLSRLTNEQVKALFDDKCGTENEKTMRHLQLVSSQEIAKGFHLLSGRLTRMLSDTQIALLDFSSMTKEQVNDLFGSYHFQNEEEHKKRVQLIPERFVNDVTKTNSCIIESLSPSQYRVLKTDLLNQEAVRNLFPGFAINTLHPGYTYSVRDGGSYGMRHEFKLEAIGSSSMNGYSKEELDDKLKKNKAHCMKMAKNFSLEQLRIMQPLMHPECQELIAKN